VAWGDMQVQVGGQRQALHLALLAPPVPYQALHFGVAALGCTAPLPSLQLQGGTHLHQGTLAAPGDAALPAQPVIKIQPLGRSSVTLAMEVPGCC
jgi:hypothetical protein